MRWQRSVVSVVSVVVACNWYKFTDTTLIYMAASVLSVLRIIVSLPPTKIVTVIEPIVIINYELPDTGILRITTEMNVKDGIKDESSSSSSSSDSDHTVETEVLVHHIVVVVDIVVVVVLLRRIVVDTMDVVDHTVETEVLVHHIVVVVGIVVDGYKS